MAREHLPVQLACRVLHVAESGHSALGMFSPVEYELRTPPVECSQATRLHSTRDSPLPPQKLGMSAGNESDSFPTRHWVADSSPT